jgi:serine protease AprX
VTIRTCGPLTLIVAVVLALGAASAAPAKDRPAPPPPPPAPVPAPVPAAPPAPAPAPPPPAAPAPAPKGDDGKESDDGKKGGDRKDGKTGVTVSVPTVTAPATTTVAAPVPAPPVKPKDKAKDSSDSSNDGGAKGDDRTGRERTNPKGADPAAPAPAPAPVPPETKIDTRLADAAATATAADPKAKLRVLVVGSNAKQAVVANGGSVQASIANVAGAEVSAADVQSLAAASGVAYVMLDVPVLPTAAADTSSVLGPPFPQLVGAPAAWSRGLVGKGVGIAVIDSGVAAVPAFAGRRLVPVDLPGRSATGDAYGHGTFVAGIAAGSDGDRRGIAPGATVYGVNVSRDSGVYTSDVLAGLDWVLRNHKRLKIRVVSLALSESVPSSYLANPLDTAVERLWHAGVVVVASAGNGGPGSALFAPGNDPFAIAVGALDLDGTPAAFSTSGVTPDGFSKPDLFAPGRRIVSTLPAGSVLGGLAPAENIVAPGYAFMSGTSMSAPQVAGAVADLLQQHPQWTPDQVKWVLARTAKPVGSARVGALDLARAVAFRGTPQSANLGILRGAFGFTATTAALRALRDQEMPTGSPTFDANAWTANAWTANAWTANAWTANAWK